MVIKGTADRSEGGLDEDLARPIPQSDQALQES